MIANNYREAISGVSDSEQLNHDWEDKPHRLVYDLCNEVEKLQTAMQKLISVAEECDGWESFPAQSIEDAYKVIS